MYEYKYSLIYVCVSIYIYIYICIHTIQYYIILYIIFFVFASNTLDIFLSRPHGTFSLLPTLTASTGAGSGGAAAKACGASNSYYVLRIILRIRNLKYSPSF